MKRTPLRKLSGKRRKEVNLYLKARKIYLEAHLICEACNEKPSDQIHHKKGRQGKLIHDVRYFMATDQECHAWIENNREASRRQGWLLDRLGI